MQIATDSLVTARVEATKEVGDLSGTRSVEPIRPLFSQEELEGRYPARGEQIRLEL